MTSHVPAVRGKVRRRRALEVSAVDLCGSSVAETFQRLRERYAQIGFWDTCTFADFKDAVVEGATLAPSQALTDADQHASEKKG